MKISIFGMGYVGVVSAACLAKSGHQIVAVDINKTKLDLIAASQSPIIENDLQQLIVEANQKNRLKTTQDTVQAIQQSDISIICVGTPSYANGSLNLSHVSAVCEQIGRAIKEKGSYHVVVMRSTVLPGTAKDMAIPLLENSSGKKAGKDFGYVSNPEFMREGTAIFDFFNPPKTVIGASDQKSGDTVAALYAELDAPLIRTDIAIAEMVKYADNAWHATKVSFANEIGNIASAMSIDGQKVMDIFCQDRKLNLSSYYLKPGFAFGGSCLPKDVRAITYKANKLDLKTPLLHSLIPSNEEQVQRAFTMVQQTGQKKIAMLGLSFKADTDDLRESPLVELAEMFIGKGYDIKIYDKNVHMATLHGSNKDYLLNHIPHISGLLSDDLDAVIAHADVLIVGNKAEEFDNIDDKVNGSHHLVDLVRVSDKTSANKYQGICW